MRIPLVQESGQEIKYGLFYPELLQIRMPCEGGLFGKGGDIAVTCIIATAVGTPPDMEPLCWRLLTHRLVITDAWEKIRLGWLKSFTTKRQPGITLVAIMYNAWEMHSTYRPVFTKEQHMVKQVQMTFRVDSELRTRFSEAAGLEDRAAAQILREFMQTYITNAKEKAQVKFRITPDEQRKRQAAVNAARASVGLEGFQLAPDTERIAQRFSDGEIDFNEFMRVPPMQSTES